MNTQDTPVHLHLWHRDFWCLSVANLLFSMVVYGQVFMVQHIVGKAHLTQGLASLAWLTYGLGLSLLGFFVSFLVQRFRRNHVCIMAMIGVAVAIFCSTLVPSAPVNVRPMFLLCTRLAIGMLFGLSQMVLSSTLVIDICESYQRTEANYAVAWFGRLAMALGPFVFILVDHHFGWQYVMWIVIGLDALAVFLVMVVDFPFRMPSDNIRLFSLDRFLLLRSWMLFINLFLVSVAIGIVVALHWNHAMFFAFMMVGFLLAILAEKFVFVNAELKSEAVAGMILLGFALLMMWTGQDTTEVTSAICIGLGTGLISSRFLLFFIKLRDHCQRGTSQSTYFISWESGMAVGIALGSLASDASPASPSGFYHDTNVLSWCLIILIVSLATYVAFTHQWYLKHKNR